MKYYRYYRRNKFWKQNFPLEIGFESKNLIVGGLFSPEIMSEQDKTINIGKNSILKNDKISGIYLVALNL